MVDVTVVGVRGIGGDGAVVVWVRRVARDRVGRRAIVVIRIAISQRSRLVIWTEVLIRVVVIMMVMVFDVAIKLLVVVNVGWLICVISCVVDSIIVEIEVVRPSDTVFVSVAVVVMIFGLSDGEESSGKVCFH